MKRKNEAKRRRSGLGGWPWALLPTRSAVRQLARAIAGHAREPARAGSSGAGQDDGRAALTIARMPALSASGREGHASRTRATSGPY